MFPIAHNYMICRLIEAKQPPFERAFSELERDMLLVGSILPDFVAGMGLERNFWHEQGRQFHDYCRANLPEAEPLALGIWLHGIDGVGFDTYADEVWQGKLGWCFLKCLPYIPDAVIACRLPREFALWKAHNLVEMAAEIEIAAHYQELGAGLMAALHNEQLMQLICLALGDFAGANAERVRPILQTMEQRFSILNVTAKDCAVKYLGQLKRRHDITGGNAEQLAALLEQIRADLKPEFWQWFDEVFALMNANLQKYF